MVTVFYHLKFELLFMRRLFNFFMLKTIVLSFTYLYVCVLVPLYFDMSAFRFIFHQFFFILILCLIFDMRDIDHDRERKINTLATFLGFSRSRLLCIILIAVKLLLLILATRLETGEKIALAITDFILLLHIVRLDNKKEELFYFFYLDGMLLLQFVLFLLSDVSIRGKDLSAFF